MAEDKKGGTATGPVLPKDAKHLLYLNPGEEMVYHADGLLDDSVKGTLVLTNEKLFFYFESNISREQIFIGRHAFIVEAKLKEGFMSSELSIRNKKESFSIRKMKKDQARKFYGFLKDITEKNRSV